MSDQQNQITYCIQKSRTKSRKRASLTGYQSTRHTVNSSQAST